MELNRYQMRIIIIFSILVTFFSILAIPVDYIYPEENITPPVEKKHFSFKPIWATGKQIAITLPVPGKKNTWTGRVVDININFVKWFLIILVLTLWAIILFILYSDKYSKSK